MRSTFFGLETMRRAILTHQRAQDVIGHNIANASTPGYSRQQVMLSSTDSLYYPADNRLQSKGQIGTGVVVQEIRRIRDVFIDNQLRIAYANKGKNEIEKNVLRQIENIFLEPSSTEGLNDALSKFFSAWEEVSKRPENLSPRIQLRQMAENFINVVHNIDQSLRQVRSDLEGDLRKNVAEIDRICKEITKLNFEIAKIKAIGDQPNDLKDKRDLLLDELAKYFDFTVIDTDLDQIAVLVGGRTILRDQQYFDVANIVFWDHPAQNTQTPQYTDVSTDDYKMIINFSKGEMKGILNARDNIVVKVQEAFTSFVQSFINEVNALHSKGFGLDGTTGVNFFNCETRLPESFEGDTTPDYYSSMISTLQLPETITLSSSISDLESALGGIDITGGKLSLDGKDETPIAINDDMTLEQVFNLINSTRTFSNGGNPLDIYFDTINHRIVLKGMTKAALKEIGGTDGSESNLLRVLGFEGQSIVGFQLPLGSNPQITLADLGITDGDIYISGVKITIDSSKSLSETINQINTTFSFLRDGRDLSLYYDSVSRRLRLISRAHYDTDSNNNIILTNSFSTSTPSGGSNFLSITGLAGDSHVQNTPSITSSDAGARIRLSQQIVKAVESIATAGSSAGLPGDNYTAVLISQLKDKLLMDNLDLSPFAKQPQSTFDDYYNSLIAHLGTESQQAIVDSQILDRLIEYYEKERENVSGVNIDEELTKMIQVQKSFNAAARMVNTIDEMLDRIINGMGLVGR